MKKEDKVIIIEKLGEQLKEHAHFYLVDVTGMNAEATSALRRKAFGVGVKMVVVKNTLLHKAFEASEVDFTPLYGCLKGTTAVFFCETANVPAKLLKETGKDGIPALKGAYAEEVSMLVQINSKLSAQSRAKTRLSPKLLLCCSRPPRMLSLLFLVQVRPFTVCLKLWANALNKSHITPCRRVG